MVMIGPEFTKVSTQTDRDGKRISEISFRVIGTRRKLGLNNTAEKKGHEGNSKHSLFFAEAVKISREEGEWRKGGMEEGVKIPVIEFSCLNNLLN
jgi:hypothetical protein